MSPTAANALPWKITTTHVLTNAAQSKLGLLQQTTVTLSKNCFNGVGLKGYSYSWQMTQIAECHEHTRSLLASSHGSAQRAASVHLPTRHLFLPCAIALGSACPPQFHVFQDVLLLLCSCSPQSKVMNAGAIKKNCTFPHIVLTFIKCLRAPYT